MERDMDLIRAILLEIEAIDLNTRIGKLQIDDYSRDDIDYHIYLMVDAGLIDADLDYIATNTSVHYSSYIRRITWDGHEFLDACRDEGIWNEAKTEIESKVLSVSFDVLKTVLVTLSSKAVLAGLG